MLWWSVVEEILERRRWMGMQSKAFERSMEAMVVREGGLASLNPLEMAAERLRREEVVEWRGLKLCWVGWVVRGDLRAGSRSLSRTLTAGQRREIGR